MALIEIDNASYTYDGINWVLEGINLCIVAHQSVSISGPNGAGKSTLVKMIMGLVRPNEGKVTLFDEDIARTSTAQISRKVGYVFQNPRLQIFHRTVLSEVAFSPQRWGMPAGEIKALAREALKATGLENKEYSHPYDLNPAERKLLAIASVLAMNPQVIILDEPTAGMDFASRERVTGVIQACLAEGRTVITVTHDIELAARVASRLVVLLKGRIIADGEIHQLFSQPEQLAAAHLEGTAIQRLSRACDLPASLLTVNEMVDYLVQLKEKR